MKSKSSEWSDEQDAMVEYAIDQAVSCVMEQFDALIETLEPASRNLIREHFAGTTSEQLGKKHNLTTEQIDSWLAKIRRQLGQSIRQSYQTKQ
jgi:hypothetical protein